ncbi:spore gernimation protein GerPD [Lentibacillus cibarius]|uniref:Spore gernimation protein GerPD n=1 Tax=Lentibacillus cibarius TaxID=2583219 RepID=A0A549YJ42_9BACI|nr:spore gernimation protein GerPD [Lentibacillus cibarius]TMN23067.1 spore gernimation protein GerPD [Lentibacillus cibarius]TRM11874.1 spore gernimation protein GerPD [Lentibacillus cibarius]
MNMEVHNWELCVDQVDIGTVTASSVFLIGDNERFVLSSFFDTPPEAATIGTIVPLSG